MRLTAEETAGIKAAVSEQFGPGASVRLFGRRLDDARRGGDIDLLVETPPGRDGLREECALAVAIHERIGERKVDILLVAPGRPLAPIETIALRGGVRL